MGNTIWAKSIGGSKDDHCFSIGLDALNNIYLGGYFKGPTLQIGSEIRFNADSTNGSSDIFIAKLDHLITGIETINKKDLILLYPNPTPNYFTIELINDYKNVTVTIYDLTGKLIYSKFLLSSTNINLNASDFTSGIYLVQIQTDKSIQTKRLSVSHFE